MTYVDNTGTTACTAKVTFAESFHVAKSEWSNAGFIINDIVDDANVATVFSHTITGIDGNANITELLITFTDSTQFGNVTKTLLFRLKAQNFGYPTATTKYAKVTAVSDTLAGFLCGGCSGATPYLEISTGLCVATCPSPKYTGLSAEKGLLCVTPEECDSEGLITDDVQELCRDTCNAAGNGLQMSDLICSEACVAADTFTSASTATYCKELDKQMNYVDNTGATACTAKVTFAESFHVAKSEWSNAGFIINDIVDNDNVATVFNYTITGIDGNAAITEMLITFTDASQFSNVTKTLLFRLKAQNFGYPNATTKYAKVTAVSETLSGFLCGGCGEATPYLEISSGTCVATCSSPKYTGLSAEKGQLCVTPEECDSEGLITDDVQELCRDTCNAAGNGLQMSDLICSEACVAADTFTSASTATYCKELDKQMTYVDNTGTTACTARVTFAESFHVAKSEWSNASFIIGDIVDNDNIATDFSHSITGIDGNANITEL